MGAELFDRIQEIRAIYPEGTQSALLPALRLAQEQYGWLSPDALREVADALDLTPAVCKSVASFYDQFHLGQRSAPRCVLQVSSLLHR